MSHQAKKRSQEKSEDNTQKKRGAAAAGEAEEEEFDEEMLVGDNGLVFEDPFYDEFEEEIMEENEEEEDDEEDEEEDTSDNAELNAQKKAAKAQRKAQRDAEEKGNKAPKQVWRPGIDKLPEGEELEYDPSAYIMYHSMRTEWPCLSFDVLRDTLGDNRQRFPQTMFLVTGSQADRPEKNKVTLLKITDLHKTHVQDDSDDENDNENEEEDNLDEDPTIEHVNVNHYGGVNRIRNMPQVPGIVATMSDTGHNHIYDLSHVVKSMTVNNGPRATAPTKPVYSFQGHREEGYALDWSPVVTGRLATGDCSGKIHVWNPTSASMTNWQVDSAGNPYQGHRSSVEDLQWSRTEASVFASCSSDRPIRVWDVRDRSKSQITWDAHNDDINVITWNRNVGYLLASGCDDGSFKVWDLRQVRSKGCPPLAHFTFHHAPVTSIEWAPHDESMLAVSSADNQISIWDLSVEADEEEQASRAINQELADYPPQLLFLHMGQTNIKEVHFHPQIPGTLISTAEDSFNIFKPAITVSS